MESSCKECLRYFLPLTINDEDGNNIKEFRVLSLFSSDTPIAEQSSASIVLKSPITITVPTNENIIVSVTVKDSARLVFSKFQNVDVLFTKISVSKQWTQQTYSYTQSGRKAQLTLNYRLVRCSNNFIGNKCNRCEDNYYSDRCNVECVPVEGNYTCDKSTGEKVCALGKEGDNCDNCENNNKVGQNCDTCKIGFTEDECDRCAQNYYPEGTCNVICEPEEDKYKCLESGAKECLGNRAGEECKECKLNYYGADCEIICENSTTYICDQAGNKICQDNYFNPETDCDTFCENSLNHTCDQMGSKVCQDTYYPERDCSILCDPTQGSYTCDNATGEKTCDEGKTSANCDHCENNNKIEPDCEKCKQHYFGEECQQFCEPNEYLNCSSEGEKSCINNSTRVENSCRHVESSTDTIMIGGAGGGGGLLLIVLVIVIIVRCRGGRNKDVTEEIDGEEGIDPTLANQEAVYSRINKQQVEFPEEDQDVYSHLNNKDRSLKKLKKDNRFDRRQEEIDQGPIYSTVDKQREDEASQMYAQMVRPVRSKTQQPLQSRTTTADDDGNTYADVAFVKNRRGEEAAVYRNQRENNRREATYATVSEMIGQKL